MVKSSPDSEPEKQAGKGQKTKPSISLENFYSQIQSIPSLVQQAIIIDHVLTSYFTELKETSEKIVSHFSEEKKKLLAQFDPWLLPVVNEVLDELLNDAIRLNIELNETMACLKKTSEMDWDSHLKNWEQLYKKWYDRKELNKKILTLLSAKTNQLIEKDIKIIKDYQNQTLLKVAQSSSNMNQLERKLVKATAEPLKKLLELKVFIERDVSIKQASDWAAELQTKRESYFNQVLLKIDSIVREVVYLEEAMEGDHSRELEGEMKFVEGELSQILDQMGDEVEAKSRLNGLKEHLEQYSENSMPIELKNHLDALLKKIDHFL
ncbi:MAG: hypothetical protein LW832_03875 [Parachlamydia sp.]|jgi:hypothetical protein|nr:hypothetical protein [Parachlamydia sp.]